jgi:hypothetical protein
MQIVSPNRLITEEELLDWQIMTQDVMKAGKAGVVVGVPGKGSYKKYEGIFQFGLGLSLKKSSIDSDGQDIGVYDLHIPVPIKTGDKTIGYQICAITSVPDQGKTFANFVHSKADIYWHEMAKKTG